MDEPSHDDPEEQRWLRMLHALFTVALLVPTGYSVIEPAAPLTGTLVLVGGLVAWYVVMFALPPFRRTLLTTAVYVAGAIGFLTALTLRDGVFVLLMYALIPQIFSLLPRWAAVVATAAMVLLAPVLGGGVDQNDVFTLVAVLALGLVITAGIESLGRRNDEQRLVISQLEATRAENERLAEEAAAQGRHAGVLAERQRLAHEIHDTLAQGFTSIVTQLEAAEQATATGDEPLAARRVARAKRTARDGLAEARRTVEALRPASLEEVDLPDALRALTTRWRGDLPRPIDVDVVVDGHAVAVPDDVEVALLRVAQEALTNVARHAAADRVTVTCSYLDDLLLLDVQDDGAGFDPAAAGTAGHGRTGFGLTSMRERIALVGGELSVESVPGEGTTIAARVALQTVRPPTRGDAAAARHDVEVLADGG